MAGYDPKEVPNEDNLELVRLQSIVRGPCFRRAAKIAALASHAWPWPKVAKGAHLLHKSTGCDLEIKRERIGSGLTRPVAKASARREAKPTAPRKQ